MKWLKRFHCWLTGHSDLVLSRETLVCSYCGLVVSLGEE